MHQTAHHVAAAGGHLGQREPRQHDALAAPPVPRRIDHCAEPTKLTQKLAASHLDDYTYLRINLSHKMRKPDRGSMTDRVSRSGSDRWYPAANRASEHQLAARHTAFSVCPARLPERRALEVERIDATRIGVSAARGGRAYTDGVVCAKVGRYAERQYHPERLSVPLRRVGDKGVGHAAFAPISWDDARPSRRAPHPRCSAPRQRGGVAALLFGHHGVGAT